MKRYKTKDEASSKKLAIKELPLSVVVVPCVVVGFVPGVVAVGGVAGVDSV